MYLNLGGFMYTFQDDGVVQLTRREREVLIFVAEGRSAKETAMKLRIAPCTVERHIENVRLKTRTRNRAHMVAYVIINGLLPSGEVTEYA